MEAEFWHGRWSNNDTTFHQEEINPHLKRYLSELSPGPDDRIFVPLCGKSQDLKWLVQQGRVVVGIELSPLAVEALFREYGKQASRVPSGSFERWRHGRLEVLCGDFFQSTVKDIGAVNAVYDRASLIALPAAMRRKYAAHMAGLLSGGARVLLITLEYQQSEMEGPPFSVDNEEVNRLFSPWFDIEPLSTADILETHPRFKEWGLSRLNEKVYRMTRKKDDRRVRL